MLRYFPTVALAYLLTTGCAAPEYSGPSDQAQALSGAKGIMLYQPADWQPGQTTWWQSTDGLAPGVAGCHVGTDGSGAPNGRMYGEACLAGGLLVETNEAADELHRHSDDIAHPDTFDCNQWCIGQGSTSGLCQVAAAPPCVRSAACICN